MLSQSAIILGERFTTVQYLASFLVLAGVILTQDHSTTRQPVATPLPES